MHHGLRGIGGDRRVFVLYAVFHLFTCKAYRGHPSEHQSGGGYDCEAFHRTGSFLTSIVLDQGLGVVVTDLLSWGIPFLSALSEEKKHAAKKEVALWLR
jgi:hypothetical protein